jgi:hypothetical protein
MVVIVYASLSLVVLECSLIVSRYDVHQADVFVIELEKVCYVGLETGLAEYWLCPRNHFLIALLKL